MTSLKAWLDQEGGRSAALSRHLSVPPSFVHKMANGDKPIPVRHMAAIEAFTRGAVTRQSMCPDDWQRIWPELAEQQPEGQGVCSG